MPRINRDKKGKKKQVNVVKSKVATSPKKPHRFLPGTVALREIRKYQQTVKPFTRRAPLRRLIKKKLDEQAHDDYQVSDQAVRLLQEAVEAYAVRLFAKANKHAIEIGERVTVTGKDVNHEISCRNM